MNNRIFSSVVGLGSLIWSAMAAFATCPSDQAYSLTNGNTKFPYILANQTTADAGRVMADYAHIANCPNFTGNVGVGTPNPAYTLDVNGPIHALMAPAGFSSWSGDANAPYGIGLSAYGNNAGIFGRQRNASGWPTYTDMIFYVGNDGDERFEWYPGVWTGSGDYLGQEAMELNAYTGQLYVRGNVGIGTTAPNARLTLSAGADNNLTFGAANGYNVISLLGQGNNSGANMGLIGGASGDSTLYVNSDAGSVSLRTSSVQRLTVINNGNVGIGTISPSTRLDVAGDLNVQGNTTNNSDARLKTGVSPLQFGALEAVMKLRPVSFRWITPKDEGMKGEQIGFIAQDVEKILPAAVTVANDKIKTKGIKYNELTALAIRAIQEQQLTIVQLKVELAKIQQKNKELEARLNRRDQRSLASTR